MSKLEQNHGARGQSWWLSLLVRPTRSVTPMTCILLICGFAVGFGERALPAQNEAGSGQDSEDPDPAMVVPGISSQRLDSAKEIFQATPSLRGTSDAARVMWGLGRLPDDFWRQSLENETDGKGQVEVLSFRGRVTNVDAVRVPADLAELIELDKLYRLTVAVDPDAGQGLMMVLAAEVPEIWAKAGTSLDEAVEVIGLATGFNDKPAVVFAKRVRWMIGNGENEGAVWPVGWRLLGARGLDCGLLGAVAKRSRGPLVAQDNEAFYGMLAAVARVRTSDDTGTADDAEAVEPNESPSELLKSSLPKPRLISMPELLRENRELVGHWLRLNLETARISRIIVTDPKWRELLGSDSYWQIDGFGDLERVRIELEGKSEDGADGNLVFENRFPVSVAIVRLPEWLRQKVDTAAGGVGRVDVSMVTEPVTIDAFFYRLWSYESEFATSRGGRQVAPLLIAADINSRAAGLAATAGQVQSLGWMLAVVVIGSILLTSGVLWRVGRRDAAVKAKRRRDLELRDRGIKPF